MHGPHRLVPFVALVVVLGGSSVLGDTIVSLSLSNPGSATVRAGTPVTLEIRGTFDTRLSATAFSLSASGLIDLTMLQRSAAPLGPGALTYVPFQSPDPNEDDLPHDLVALPKLEVLFDNDFDASSGGATDGLPPGSGVLIEEIVVRPQGIGTIDLNLSNVVAVHTTGPPTGSLFDLSSVGTGVLSLTVIAGPGDTNTDGYVTLTDHVQLPGCLTGPNAGPAVGPCDVFDFGPDNDVDLGDVAEFQKIFGPP